ncbi:MAG: ATP synthase F1 subunit delta [Candidatus Humimicrobiaceae bacterium]
MVNKGKNSTAYLAKSFLNIARAENSIEKLEQELEALRDMLDSNVKLKELLSDKTIPEVKRISNLFEVLGENATPAIKAVASAIISLELLDGIDGICREYSGLVNKFRKQVDVEVVSAVKLDKKTISKINRKVKGKINLDVRIKNIVDKSIIGGIIIQIKDEIIDLSIKNKMEQLKDDLKSIDLRGEKLGT